MIARRPPIIALSILALALSAGAASAQNEPAEVEPPVEGDIVAMFPTELDGEPFESTVQRGSETLEALDPDNEEDAEQITEINAMLEAAGATIDDMTIVTGFRVNAENSGWEALIQAAQVNGVEEQVMRDVVQELFITAWEEFADGSDLRREERQVNGKDVIALVSTDSSDVEEGDANGMYFYVTGDTAWVVAAPERVSSEVLDRLP